MNTANLSRTAVTGHLRRAQSRITRAFEGQSSEDVFIQAACGAAAASVALRLLRAPGVGAFVARWAPMLVFAAFYQRVTSRGKR